MKKLLIGFLFLIPLIIQAQGPVPSFTAINNAQAIKWIHAVNYFGIPYGPALTLNVTQRGDKPALFYLTADSVGLYYYQPSDSTWKNIGTVSGGGGGGGINIYNTDSVLSGNRTLGLNGYQLNITGSGSQDGSNFKSGDILLSMGDASSHGFKQISKTVNGSAYWQSLIETGQTNPITIETEAIADTVNNTGTWNTHVDKAGSYRSHLDVNQDGIYLKTGAASATEQLGILSTGGIRLPATVDSTTGVIFKGSDRFIHSYQNPATSTTLGTSLYIGRKSGNFNFTGASGGYGGRNTAIGDSTLFANTTGFGNIAIGIWSLAANTSGFENMGIGRSTLFKNTIGWQNTAVGAISLQYNTTGQGNTAMGVSSLQFNVTGERNTAIGVRAMTNSSTSFANVAVGLDALSFNTTGDHNVGVGLDAMYYSNGTHNVAVGDSTLWGLYPTYGWSANQKHMGYKNTAIGSRAGYHKGDSIFNYASIFDTAVTFLGANSSRDSSIAYTTSLKNMTVIGYDARGFASNQVVLGNDDVTTTLLKGAVGIGTRTPDASSIFDGVSTTKGVLLPRMNTTQQNAISSPAVGLIIFNTDTADYMVYKVSSWVRIGGAGSSGGSGINIYNTNDTLTANRTVYGGSSGRSLTINTTGSVQFLGTGAQSTKIGLTATSSNDNTIAIGTLAQATASAGTAIGSATYASGIGSTALGYGADAGTNQGTALGHQSLVRGLNSTAVGYAASAPNANTIIIGAINGVNGSTGDVEVGFGLTAPDSSVTVNRGLHVKRGARFSGLLQQSLDTTNYKLGVFDGSGNLVKMYWPASGSMVYPGAGIPVSTGSAWGTSITDNSANWNTAYTDRLNWDGGNTGLVAGTGRTSLGGTTIGQNIFTSTNPSAIRFGRANADNSFDWLDASTFRSAIGAGTGSGDLLAANNLADVSNVTTARNNILPSKTGNTLKVLRVNAGETDYELATISGGSTTTTDNLFDITSSVLTAKKTPLALTDGATITWNAATGYNSSVTLAGNRTLAITNPQEGDFYTIIVKQDGTGFRTLTLPGGGIARLNLMASDSTTLSGYYRNSAYEWRSSAPEENFVALTSTYTLTSTTSSQKLFNATTNGALAVAGSTSYFFECQFRLSSMSATSGNTKFDLLGAGTATLTSTAWSASGVDNTSPATSASSSASYTAASISSTNVVAAGTGTGVFVTIQGIFRVNAGGTIIPSVALTTAAAAVVGVNSYFKCRPIGSNTVTTVGGWN